MDYSQYPKTRKEAQESGSKYYFTGLPCKHGHIDIRKTKGVCVSCMKLETIAYAEKRKDYFDSYNKSEAGAKTKKKYYEKNKELVIAKAMSRPNEDKQRYRQKWKENNPEFVKADDLHRRRKHRDATPKWLTQEHKNQIRAIYFEAMEKTKTTGEKYAVDHIVPLRGKLVSGLHVPWNLAVITREENSRKSNKY
jgi:hypothetical protein